MLDTTIQFHSPVVLKKAGLRGHVTRQDAPRVSWRIPKVCWIARLFIPAVSNHLEVPFPNHTCIPALFAPPCLQGNADQATQTNCLMLTREVEPPSGSKWRSSRGVVLCSVALGVAFPCQGFQPNPPFPPRLPRRPLCVPLLTSRLLMPFPIDHYPPLPSPPLASAQSEMPASARSRLCGRRSREGKRLRSATFDRSL